MKKQRSLEEIRRRQEADAVLGFLLIQPDGRQFHLSAKGKEEIFEGHHLWVKRPKEQK